MNPFHRLLLLAILLWLLPGPSIAANSPPRPPRFLAVVSNNFAIWDTNHDGVLSKEEVDAAVENPAFKGPAAAAVATLRRIGFATNLPLTWDRIHQLADDTNVRPWAIYFRALTRIDRVTHRELFVSGLPQLQTIHQGAMGNCFCLAPLGAMVHRDPREVAAWFETQTNGNILVKMASGAVSVPPPTDAELAFASGNAHDGTWINLYEKAIAEARNERKPPGKRFDVALEAIAKGGSAGPILSYITGHKVRGQSLRFQNDPAAAESRMIKIRRQMADAVTNKLLMVCGTFRPSTPGITPRHAYAILDFQPQSNTVTLWNPHGNNFQPKGPDGLTNGYFTTNGVFTMPFNDWTNQFTQVVIERPEKTSIKWPDQWQLEAQAGRFSDAARDLSAVIDSDDTEGWERYILTPLLIQSGRLADYTNHCKAMLDELEKTTNPAIAERTSKSCLLLPSGVEGGDLARAAKLAARAVDLSQPGNRMHWRYMTRGLAEYRTGHFKDALNTEPKSREALKSDGDPNGNCCQADTWFITAMAHEKLHQHKTALADFHRGQDIVQTRLPKLDSGDLGEGWFDTLMANILMREANAMVLGTEKGASQKSESSVN